MYTSMAHFVGEKLHIRPNEILDTWGVAELLVAYGQYANEAAQEIFYRWKNTDPKSRVKIPRPKEYAVKFFGVNMIEEE